jgi:hypothetical protein
MSNSINDPAVHRQKERELLAHVERLLDDDRLRVDTKRGRRPVRTLIPMTNKSS